MTYAKFVTEIVYSFHFVVRTGTYLFSQQSLHRVDINSCSHIITHRPRTDNESARTDQFLISLATEGAFSFRTSRRNGLYIQCMQGMLC